MNFDLEKSIEILERTPTVLNAMLQNISADWTLNNEGEDSWSAYDIIGHLIHGEKTDWMPRAEIILSENSDKSFTPYDRFAQFEESKGKSLQQLLDEFEILREFNMGNLRSKILPTGIWNEKAFILLSGKLVYRNFLPPGWYTT